MGKVLVWFKKWWLEILLFGFFTISALVYIFHPEWGVGDWTNITAGG